MQITELTLYSSNLNQLKDFYTNILDIPLHSETENHIGFVIGDSLLKFKYQLNSTPYHIAINIPSNKEHEALAWLKDRVAILNHFDDEIIDFINWNAKAIYFYDTDKNIIEFIARKNLKTDSLQPFTSLSLLEISEIGMPVNHIEKVFQTLNKTATFPIYFGDLNKFCAIGNERGLFIVIDKNHKNWFPTNDKAFASDFKAVIFTNDKQYTINFSKGELAFT